MAIINHTGNIQTDETWSNTDEHHITGNVTIGKAGDATRVVVTAEEDQTIYFDGAFSIMGQADGGGLAKGRFQIDPADWSKKVAIRSDPTTFPEPRATEYNGFYVIYDLQLYLRFTEMRHCNMGMVRPHSVVGAQNDGDVDIQKCVGRENGCICRTHAVTNVVSASNFTFKNNFFQDVRNGMFAIMNLGFPGPTFTGVWDIDHNYVHNLTIPGARLWNDQLGEADFDPPYRFYEWVVDEIAGCIYGACKANRDCISISHCYFGAYVNPAEHAIYPYGIAGAGAECLIDSCIFDQGSSRAVFCNNAAYLRDFTVRNCDIRYFASYALFGRNGAGIGNIDDVYMYGNNNRYCAEPGAGADEFQYLNMEGARVIAAQPNFPLEIDNISVGAPTFESVTITFDSKAGPTGLRRHGVGFVRYGTTSGGPYTGSTPHPQNAEERGMAWSQIRTDLGQYKTTNHSVTISELKAGTTYYACPCLIGPLGEVTVGAEQTFTTAAAGVDQGYWRNVERRV